MFLNDCKDLDKTSSWIRFVGAGVLGLNAEVSAVSGSSGEKQEVSSATKLPTAGYLEKDRPVNP
jgi:hypothetical protein